MNQAQVVLDLAQLAARGHAMEFGHATPPDHAVIGNVPLPSPHPTHSKRKLEALFAGV